MTLGLTIDQSAQTPIVTEARIPVSPARAFEAWTSPNIVLKWFGKVPGSLHSVEIDLRIGGVWRFVKSETQTETVALEGKYLEIEPDHRLAYTWQLVTSSAEGGRDVSLHAHIEVTFDRTVDGTKVRIIHSPLRARDSLRGIGDRWALAIKHLVDLLGSALLNE